MKLRDGNLSIRMHGDDVERLHEELQKLGVSIPDTEIAEGVFGQGTEQAVKNFQEKHGLQTSGVVDKKTAAQINREGQGPGLDTTTKSFVVKGRVVDAEGMPVADATARAYHKALRAEVALAEGATDQTGQYWIAYALDKIDHGQADHVNLFVRAYDQNGEEIATSEDEAVFDAKQHETVNLVTGGGSFREPAESVQLQTTLAPLLKDVSPIDLTADDVAFLAGESGLDVPLIDLLVRAAQLANETNLPADVFYALGRQDLPTDLEDLLRQPPAVWRSALETALADRIVPARQIPSTDAVVARLQTLAVDQALTGDDSLGALLRTWPLLAQDEAVQKAFARAYLQHQGPLDALLDDVRKQPEFAEAGVVDALQLTLDLGTLTGQYVPLVKAVQTELQQNGAAPQLRDLARWDKAKWEALIEQTGVSPNKPAHSAEDYALLMQQRVEQTFPSAVVAHQMVQDLPDESDLVHFLNNNPDFDFGRTHVDRHLQQNGETAPEGGGVSTQLVQELESWARIYRVCTPHDRYKAMRALKNQGLDSAQAITRLGPNAFVRQFADALGDEEKATLVWEKASQKAALALNVFADYGAAFNTATPSAIPTITLEEFKSKLEGMPTLHELFGSQDYCECEHCKSVYGPAAYLVDLLNFLQNASKKNGRSPLTVLLSRRPDLAELELSCANTNTVMPYVDLVNEALENAMSWFLLKYPYVELDDAQLKPALREKFNEGGFRLSAGAKMSMVKTREQWRVTDGAMTYVIIAQKGKSAASNVSNVFVLLKNQTRAKTDELQAQPEHLNEKAYEKLEKAVYPWSLPFSLWFAEAQRHLEHLRFKRYAWKEKLMLRQPKPTKYDLAYDVACDHLGLTSLERDLITGTANRQEYELWGLRKQDWPEKLRQVRKFLKQAGFDLEASGKNFRALRQLLIGTRYLNHDDAIKLLPPMSCNLDQAKIDNEPQTDAAKRLTRWKTTLNKARRFLRLQRKLGWTINELDKAVTAFQPEADKADLDWTFLKTLSQVERLRATLNVPLVEMLSWWGRIDTAEDKAELDPQQKAKSLYEQLFLHKSLGKTANEVFKLNKQRTELAQTGEKIMSHGACVAAALGIGVKDLNHLVTTDAKDKKYVANALNLDNLSALYRIVSFANALSLSIKEYVCVKALIGDDPFTDTQATLDFAKNVNKIKASGFRIAELDYLLRHRYEVMDNVAPTDAEIAPVLGSIRSGLQKVAAETADAQDPEGKLTAKRLALVVGATDADQTVAILKETSVFRAALDNLPSTLIFPDSLKQKVSYDQTSSKTSGTTKGHLSFAGVMTKKEQAALKALLNDKSYRDAVDALYQAPRTFASKTLTAFLEPAEATKLLDESSLKTSEKRFNFLLPKLNTYLRRTLSSNLVKQQISGALSLEADLVALLLETLVDGQIDAKKKALDDFLTLSQGGLSAAYYATPDFKGTPVERIDAAVDFDWVKDTPPITAGVGSMRWRGMLQAVKSGSYSFNVEAKGDARLWINNRLVVETKAGTSKPVDMVLEAGKYYPIQLDHSPSSVSAGAVKLSWTPATEKQSSVVPAARLIPVGVMVSCRLLHKLALLLSGFTIQTDELRYLWDHRSDFEQFDLNAFPMHSTETAGLLFRQWQRLYDVFTFRDRYPRQQTRLIDVFGAAQQSVTQAKKTLCALTGWNAKALDDLAGSDGFNLSEKDYRQGRFFEELHHGVRLMRQLGATAEQLIDLAKADLSKPSVASDLKQLVKGLYTQTQWLKIAKPLRDGLRKKQRDALVDYLVHDYNLKNANALYAHFLIDVEMDSCMLTSRLKQALSSVQLFVQRSLMNLELEVTLSSKDAREWKWRKNYRVWEANRKVFLYPENWIEPELRDDKSPFFEDLENELLQNEITDENAEKAFMTYLEKLDEVDRLEIVGLYEHEDTASSEKHTSLYNNVIHVIGRTRSTSPVYYYRRWTDRTYWTPWERVDLDIEGDHLMPVVWNRRLYLLWAIFEKKTPGSKDKSKNVFEYWDVQLAWSEYKNGSWSAKQVFQKSLPAMYVRNVKSGIPHPQEMDVDTHDTECNYKKDASFKAVFINNDLKVRCYWTMYSTNWQDFPIQELWPIAEFSLIGCNDTVDVSEGYDNLKERQPILILKSSGEKYTRHHMSFVMDNKQHEYLSLDIPFTDDSLNGDIKKKADLDALLKKISSKKAVLRKAPSKHRLLPPHQDQQFASLRPFFYEDQQRTFLVVPYRFPFIIIDVNANGTGMAGNSSLGSATSSLPDPLYEYAFETFYHPYVGSFIKQLNRYGVAGVLDPDPRGDGKDLYRQQKKKGLFNQKSYDPDPSLVFRHYPVEEVDFSYGGAYAPYNWELFFHIPLLIADRLSQNQRFEEAMTWFHYIFDPTLVPADAKKEPAPARFWKVRPFFEARPTRIQTLMRMLNKGDTDMEKQVAQWKKYPFKPHAIARLRTPAYMKTVVMKYLDNLIAWGDYLFRRDTIESINEATQLYILAADILGPRPQAIPPRPRKVQTFNTLRDKLDVFSNALVKIEGKLPESTWVLAANGQSQEPLTLPSAFYFCIPRNDTLLKYWDTVEDRLFKIRHCMNIKGTVRQLPLFQPPIDPALLVRAAAAGIDISSVLDDLYAPLPHYRFQVITQKTTELCAEVRGLGAALLSALEKKDAEALALLRSRQEIKMLEAVRDIKKQQIKEAEETLEGLQKTLELVKERKNHYQQLIDNALSEKEQQHLKKLQESRDKQQDSIIYNLIASKLQILIPSISIPTGPGIPNLSSGGDIIGPSLQEHARARSEGASVVAQEGNSASIEAGHERRAQEWEFQLLLAVKEEEQVCEQTEAAEIRKAIAESELKNHELQTKNTKEVDNFMRRQFTNQQLYSWMVSQISALYFQSYQMAYDLARRAEKAFQHELGVSGTNYIQFGYWDSLKKGLLAGEKLSYDLKRMEVAYLEENKRELEINKHVSLLQLNPVALIELRETGKCSFEVPEVLFDLDYPGHYMRRIKTASLTIPCVAGPYTGVSCTLTLVRSSVRHSNLLSSGKYARQLEGDDSRFTDSIGLAESIVTSSGRDDSGLFETNLRDERFLPFEGAGAISTWQLELPTEFKPFDYDTITDLVLHLRYTARAAGGLLKQQAVSELKEAINAITKTGNEKGLARVFSLCHEFPSEWRNFVTLPKDSTDKQKRECTFDASKERFPYLFQGKSLTMSAVEAFVSLKQSENASQGNTLPELALVGEGKSVKKEFCAPPNPSSTETNPVSLVTPSKLGNWTLAACLDKTTAAKLDDILIVCHYQIK